MIKKYQDELLRLESEKVHEKEKEESAANASAAASSSSSSTESSSSGGADQDSTTSNEEKPADDATGFGLKAAPKTLCKPFVHPELAPGTPCFNCGKAATAWILWGRSY